MQEEMMKIVRNVNQLIIHAVNGSPEGVMERLRQIAVRLEDLTAEFPELKRYRLTVSGVDVPDDMRVVETVLPTMFANLAIVGKSKPPHERNAREKAALTLLSVAVEEIYEPVLTHIPPMTARNIAIELVED